MLSGYLRLSGMQVQRARVRAALTAVNPLAAASRWSRTTARRSYRVASPNSLWHIDSHLKLVRYASETVLGSGSRIIVTAVVAQLQSRYHDGANDSGSLAKSISALANIMCTC